MTATIRKDLPVALSLPVCLLIFLVDLLTPLGVAIWLGYLIVISFVAWSGRRRITIATAAVSTLCIALGFFLSPPGIAPWIATVNRAGGIALVWSAAYLIAGHRRLLERVVRQAEALRAANEQLEQQKEELRVANEQLEEQAEELRVANEQLEQQAEELRSANEELDVQAEELTASNEQLEQQAEQLKSATALLQEQSDELRAANELLVRQTGQLKDANELLQEQAEELELQAEELSAQNDELIVLTDHLEHTVEERTSDLRRANESLQAMPARLVEVQENERRSISRELHDETGQLLTSMIIRLGLLQRSLEKGESAADGIEELKRTANQLAEGLHRVAVDLRPASLDRAGLVAATEQYVEAFRSTYGLPVDLVADGLDGRRLAPEIETALYRIIQEALTNVARHAHAGQAAVLIKCRVDTVTIMVEDNGCGFDVEAARAAGRLGLTGMQERAEVLGGELTIESRPGSGTTIFVSIPCRP